MAGPGTAATAEIKPLIISETRVQGPTGRNPRRNLFPHSPLSARTEEQGNFRKKMSDTYIIEVSSQPAGIVVRNPDGYRFFAATHRFNRLEGRLFRNAREAERAAIRLARGDFKLVA